MSKLQVAEPNALLAVRQNVGEKAKDKKRVGEAEAEGSSTHPNTLQHPANTSHGTKDRSQQGAARATAGADSKDGAHEEKGEVLQEAVRLGLDHVEVGAAVVGSEGGGRAGKFQNARSGVLIAVLAALCVNLGKVCQKRGTQDLPLLQFKASVSCPPSPHILIPTHRHTYQHPRETLF